MPAYQPRPKRDIVIYNGSAVNDVNMPVIGSGRGIRIDAIGGWEGEVERRDSRTLNAGADGERAGNAYNAGRTITLSGWVHGTTWEDLQSRKRALGAIFEPSATEAVLKVPDPTTTYESTFKQYASNLTPVAWWRLNESTGTTAADARGSFPGTYTSGPTLAQTGALFGDGAYSVDFDGTDDHVLIDYHASLNPSAVTIAAWVRLDTIGATHTVVDTVNAGSTAGYRLTIDTAGRVRFGVAEAAGYSEGTGTTVLTTGTWYHVAGVIVGGQRYVYVNGVVEAGPTADTYTANTTNPLRIGRNNASANPLNGRIQDVTLYNVQLTTAQLLAMYQRGAGTAATTDTDGYERVTCRVVGDGVAFGQIDGYAQEFQVQLRASDPRIYSDLTTTVDDAASGSNRLVTLTNDGYATTPAKVIATITPSASLGGTVNGIARVAHSNGTAIIVPVGNLSSGDIITADAPNRSVDYTAAYHQARLRSFDPIALWRLNEAAGVTADNAEGTAGYDLTYSGTPLLNQTGHAAGIAAVDLDGVNDYVSRAYTAELNPSEFTIEAWINSDTLVSGQSIVWNADAAGTPYGWYLGVQGTSGAIQFGWYIGAGSPTPQLYSATPIATGTWYHVAATLSRSAAVLYLNGAVVGARSITAAEVMVPIPSADGFYVGSSGGASGFFNGRIDNVALYDRALTSVEVASLYGLSDATDTLTGGGYAFLDSLSDSLISLPRGAQTITGSPGVSDLQVQYRKARL